MVYTVTFNPALDYVVHIENLDLGMTNRSISESILPGGKGINVSVVLNNLGIKNTALGFISGFTGDEIYRLVSETGCKCDFIKVEKGFSRINIKIKCEDETEINGKGPGICDGHINELFKKIDILENGDILVLAGSIPSSISDNIYKDIMTSLKDKNVLIIVDATKNLLMNVLEYKPFLIKPNNYELCEIFNVPVTYDKNEIIKYAKILKEKGARNVLVSLAGEGAVLVSENNDVFICDAPKGNVINSVGAGDSMVAGFIAGWIETKNYEQAFKMGVSAGTASALSENFCTKQEVIKILNQLNLKKVSE